MTRTPETLELHSALPNVSVGSAAEVLRRRWAISGELRPLPGERDRNFHVRADDGREFVLKFASSADDSEFLSLQNDALTHIAHRDPAARVPRLVPGGDGTVLGEHGVNGVRHFVRLLTWLPGVPLAEWKPHTPDMLFDIGQAFGALSRSLAGFSHAGARRALKWDLGRADWIAEHVDRIRDGKRRALVTRIIETYTSEVRSALAGLRRSVAHNDGNDFNILVSGSASGEMRVSGIIDFGDLVETSTISDLAIALAYTMMGKADALTAASSVVAGYNAAFPIEEREVELLLPLVRTRLAVSVVNSALQAEVAPDNEYLRVSELAAWTLLEQLAGEHDRYATYRFREACGLTPCPAGPRVAAWLSAHRSDFASIVKHPLDGEGVHIHDYSASSTEIGAIDVWRDQARFSRHVDGVVRDAGAVVGICRYDEVRAIYTNDMFRVIGNEGPEWRTVHLGIDVDLPAGSPVFAPLAGVVHSVQDNTKPGDYGPTVILEHRVDGGVLTFWTLYGHLDRATVTRLKAGDPIGAGDLVGHMGDRDVNGGWWPHVHFQVICDLLGRSGDYTGVSRPVDRETWLSLSPDPSPLLRLPAAARAPRPASAAALVARRAERLGPSLSIAYRRPLHIVRGVMQHLIDTDGRRYLDGVNNVAHVGHAHPDVVRAGQRQMAVLNTNTRYLHGALTTYAERLTATLPDPLRVCYFVCSGSEANELALRLARAYTGSRAMIVLEAGYHGNTSSLIDVSSYKFDGPGGKGAPSWVYKVPSPDTYRGPFRSDDDEAGLKYAQAVRDAVGRAVVSAQGPASFLCESILSCAGQVVLPPGYLAEAYRHVRAAGGVCIADEVQVGFGRVGTHTWAFETQDVVPDIVTLGKPIGNGHPIGAVVTTPEIAAAFTNGMEFFSSFGGNPVSCAIALEVLDVIEREGLRERAHRVGNHLSMRLRDLMSRHDIIGDIRGPGLFLGVELVTDREQRGPATAQAKYAANRLRDLGVLLSTDGPANNILKIKPPLCFGEHDADFMAESLDRVLGENLARAVSGERGEMRGVSRREPGGLFLSRTQRPQR